VAWPPLVAIAEEDAAVVVGEADTEFPADVTWPPLVAIAVDAVPPTLVIVEVSGEAPPEICKSEIVDK